MSGIPSSFFNHERHLAGLKNQLDAKITRSLLPSFVTITVLPLDFPFKLIYSAYNVPNFSRHQHIRLDNCTRQLKSIRDWQKRLTNRG